MTVQRFVLPFTCDGRRAWTDVQQGPYVAMQFASTSRADRSLLLQSLKINGEEFVKAPILWGLLMPEHFVRLRLPVLRFSYRVELAFSDNVRDVNLICRLADDDSTPEPAAEPSEPSQSPAGARRRP